MAEADAWGAPDGSNLPAAMLRGTRPCRQCARSSPRLPTGACSPPSRCSSARSRSLIVIFLLVVASVRFLSLMAWRDDVERDAKAMLGLAAGELVNALMLADAEGGDARRRARRLIQKTGQRGSLGRPATCWRSPTARSGSRPRRPSRPGGRAATSTASFPAASRCSCSATAPASWTSGSATEDWYAAVDLTDEPDGRGRRADSAGRRFLPNGEGPFR